MMTNGLNFETQNWDSPWGRYVSGNSQENSRPRVVAFMSFDFGRRALEQLVQMHHSREINLVGVCTDDALDRRAKICKKRRTWQYLSPLAVEATQRGTEALAIGLQVPLYTGKIKTRFFIDGLLPNWRPDIIVMYGFGQVIPKEVFEYPAWGMYNLHPSDLAQGLYPGADPFGDMARDAATSTAVTAHHVTEDVDGGTIVAVSEHVPLPRDFDTSEEMLEETFSRIAPLGRALACDIIREASHIQAPVHNIIGRSMHGSNWPVTDLNPALGDDRYKGSGGKLRRKVAKGLVSGQSHH